MSEASCQKVREKTSNNSVCAQEQWVGPGTNVLIYLKLGNLGEGLYSLFYNI